MMDCSCEVSLLKGRFSGIIDMPGFIWSGIRIDRTKQIHKKGRCEKPVPKINMKPFTKKIVLENGREFYGYGFGADREVINEIVFNTSMVGYQEIMSDPSYTDQMVVMTYPLIGNYGMADEDYETKTPTIGGMIVREYNDSPSNFRYTKTLNEVFEEHDIPAIWGVDTRTLTRIIRNEGTQKVIITGADTPLEEALRKVREYALPHDMVSRVSCKKRWMSRVPNHKYDVVGGLCENNDKFAIDRMLPKIDIGDVLYIHDTGAHGSAMGYNYNGKLRSAEVLLCEDGSHRLIRRAETPRDYFATLDFLPLMKPLFED